MTDEVTEAFDIQRAARFVQLLLSYRQSIAPESLIHILADDNGLTVLKVERRDYVQFGRIEEGEVSLKLNPPEYVG